MSDIVSQLEQWRDYEYSEGELPYEVLTLGVVEIERLRAELAKLQARIEAYEAGREFDGEKITRLQDVMLKQQSVVDAALAWYDDPYAERGSGTGALSDAIEQYRALDGGHHSPDVTGIVTSDKPKPVSAPVSLENLDIPCPTCSGTGRKG